MWKLKTEEIKREWRVLTAGSPVQLQDQLNQQRELGYGLHFITEDAGAYTAIYFPMR